MRSAEAVSKPSRRCSSVTSSGCTVHVRRFSSWGRGHSQPDHPGAAAPHSKAYCCRGGHCGGAHPPQNMPALHKVIPAQQGSNWPAAAQACLEVRKLRQHAPLCKLDVGSRHQPRLAARKAERNAVRLHGGGRETERVGVATIWQGWNVPSSAERTLTYAALQGSGRLQATSGPHCIASGTYRLPAHLPRLPYR